MSAPKRDKFAALAAAQSSAAASASPAPAPPRATIVSSSSTQGGGKFAALQKAKSNPQKRDKFSALAARGPREAQPPQEPPLLQQWKQRSLQRDALWKSLEQAEVQVLELLQQTQQTVECLGQQTCSSSPLVNPDDDDDQAHNTTRLKTLLQTVPQCLQQIHDTLAPAAQYVQAYQAPTRIHRLYQARVEEGLAVQRASVLADLLALEQQGAPSQEGDGKKRKRQDEQAET